jgi:hypothetical protein
VADLDGDGHADLVVQSASNGSAGVMFGNGDGSFRTPVSITGAGDPVVGPMSLAVADLDRDGDLDVIVPDVRARSVKVVTNNGNGTFQPARDIAVSGRPTFVLAADANGDGRLDVVVPTIDPPGVVVLLGSERFQCR